MLSCTQRVYDELARANTIYTHDTMHKHTHTQKRRAHSPPARNTPSLSLRSRCSPGVRVRARASVRFAQGDASRRCIDVPTCLRSRVRCVRARLSAFVCARTIFFCVCRTCAVCRTRVAVGDVGCGGGGGQRLPRLCNMTMLMRAEHI